MTDLPLILTPEHTFTIAPTKEIPEVMQCAIALLFFTNSATFRPLTDIGGGIYEMLSHLTDSNVEYVATLLGDLAIDVRGVLQERFPEVTSVTFITDTTNPRITINLNIELNNETLTQQIYEA